MIEVLCLDVITMIMEMLDPITEVMANRTCKKLYYKTVKNKKILSFNWLEPSYPHDITLDQRLFIRNYYIEIIKRRTKLRKLDGVLKIITSASFICGMSGVKDYFLDVVKQITGKSYDSCDLKKAWMSIVERMTTRVFSLLYTGIDPYTGDKIKIGGKKFIKIHNQIGKYMCTPAIIDMLRHPVLFEISRIFNETNGVCVNILFMSGKIRCLCGYEVTSLGPDKRLMCQLPDIKF